jgi:hypothetical protein
MSNHQRIDLSRSGKESLKSKTDSGLGKTADIEVTLIHGPLAVMPVLTVED